MIDVQRPRDVPGLRDYLLAGWREGGAYQRIQVGSSGAPYPTFGPATFNEPTWQVDTLASCSMWWVTPEICSLLLDAEKSLPPDTLLERELIPRETGLVVFGMPLPGVDADTGDVLTVNAMSWGPLNLPRMEMIDGEIKYEWGTKPKRDAAIGLTSYWRGNADEGFTREQLQRAVESGALQRAQIDDLVRRGRDFTAQVHGDLWAPLGRADWLIGSQVDHWEVINTAESYRSMMEDRARLATLWLLLTQTELAVERPDVGSRQERRRAERAGLSTPTVQIIDVSRGPLRGRVSDPDGAGESGRHVTVRYPVSGHWRRQAYGPARAYRRPTWIAAHWRGPEDAPVSTTEKVRVFRKHDREGA